MDSAEFFSGLMKTVEIGQKVCDLVNELDTENQVECVVASILDTWGKHHDANSIRIAEEIVEMMKEVHEQRG